MPVRVTFFSVEFPCFHPTRAVTSGKARAKERSTPQLALGGSGRLACGRSGSGRSSDGLSGSGRTNALAGNLIVVKKVRGRVAYDFCPIFLLRLRRAVRKPRCGLSVDSPGGDGTNDSVNLCSGSGRPAPGPSGSGRMNSRRNGSGSAKRPTASCGPSAALPRHRWFPTCSREEKRTALPRIAK